MAKRISPIAAQPGQRVTAKASMRCSCSRTEELNKLPVIHAVNPTCPVHGHGRPPGTGK